MIELSYFFYYYFLMLDVSMLENRNLGFTNYCACHALNLQLIVVKIIIILSTRATGTLVHLGGDGVGDVGQLLLLLVKVLSRSGSG